MWTARLVLTLLPWHVCPLVLRCLGFVARLIAVVFGARDLKFGVVALEFGELGACPLTKIKFSGGDSHWAWVFAAWAVAQHNHTALLYGLTNTGLAARVCAWFAAAQSAHGVLLLVKPQLAGRVL
jgi:hypothetical protein